MSEVSILIAGDYSPKERIQVAIDTKSYTHLFPGIKDVVQSVDYSIINFESTIPTIDSIPSEKIGSNLKTNEGALELLKFLGFDMLTMANNHIMDYGNSALLNTIQKASVAGFDMVGVGDSLPEARAFKVIDIATNKIAILNACENEFSIATANSMGANPLDLINLSYDIKSAKERADFVILIIHGGIEHYQLPSPRMKRWYQFLIDQGVDAIFNHHQHCYSGYEVYKGKPIFYGLGNFCFDSSSDIRLRHTTYNYGYMVKLNLSDSISFDIIPYEQCYNLPGVYLLNDHLFNEFKNNISYLNSIIADESKLREKFKEMACKKRDFIYRGFYPFTGRIAYKLFSLGLIPSFLNKRRIQILNSILRCESHNDILQENFLEEHL